MTDGTNKKAGVRWILTLEYVVIARPVAYIFLLMCIRIKQTNHSSSNWSVEKCLRTAWRSRSQPAISLDHVLSLQSYKEAVGSAAALYFILSHTSLHKEAVWTLERLHAADWETNIEDHKCVPRFRLSPLLDSIHLQQLHRDSGMTEGSSGLVNNSSYCIIVKCQEDIHYTE